jgi:hypothetical protein
MRVFFPAPCTPHFRVHFPSLEVEQLEVVGAGSLFNRTLPCELEAVTNALIKLGQCRFTSSLPSSSLEKILLVCACTRSGKPTSGHLAGPWKAAKLPHSWQSV